MSFAVIVAAFLTSTVIQSVSLNVTRETSSLVENSFPSIRLLSAAHQNLAEVKMRLTVRPANEEWRRRLEADVEREYGQMRDGIDAERSTPDYPGEREVHSQTLSDVTALREALDTWRKADAPAKEAGAFDASRAATAVQADLVHLIELNVSGGERDAKLADETARKSLVLGETLDATALLLSVVVFLTIRRLLRQYAVATERAQRVAEHRAEELEGFAGRVAHDLRNPLSAVALGVGTLEKVSPSKDTLHVETFARTKAALGRTEALIDDLLGFARAGAAPVPGQQTEVRPVVEELVASAGRLQTDGLHLGVEADHVWVACSRGVLLSLCGNLLENALKYTGRQAQRNVEVRARRRGDVVLFEVEDDGPGVPATMRERIFEPFARAANLEQPGLGMGLATVKRLVERHGGRVGVRSAPKRGSIFWFELPVAEGAEAGAELRH